MNGERWNKLNEKIKEKLLEIISLCLDINSREKNTCFYRLHGHVKLLNVDVHENGWDRRDMEGYKNIEVWLRYNNRSELGGVIVKLDEAIAYLNKLKNADIGVSTK